MTVRELLRMLTDFTSDGRAMDGAVLVQCDGVLRTVEDAETRLIRDGGQRPRNTFLLIIADGPADVSEVTPTTLRPRQG